jgi:hypothetical protein
MIPQSAATTATMNNHLTTTVARTIPSTTSASKTKRTIMFDKLPLGLAR